MKKKKHVTLPRSYKPGKGHPTETLAYLNPAEHELIRQLTDGKAQRGPMGVRSYAVTTGTTTKSDNKGGAGTGQGGQGGPGGGSLSAPNRTAPSTGGSGVTGSKTGGASTQKPGAGGNSGVVDAKTVAKAAETQAQQRSTAIGKVSQAAQQNAKTISNPVSLSGAMDKGYYHSFRDSLPGQNSPNTFDKTIRPTGLVNSAHIPMDVYSKAYNPNSLSPGAQNIHNAIVDNALRTNTPVDFFSGRAARASGTLQHPLGQAIDVRLRNPTTGNFVGSETIGALAANPIGNKSLRRGRTEAVAKAIQGAIGGPYREFARGVLNSFMDNPGVYGEFNNQRWGGSFGGSWGKDYMHYDEGKVTSDVSADQAALRREAANYRGPGLSGGTMLAGGSVPGVGGVQVAGPASSAIGEATRLDRARKAAVGLDAILSGNTPPQAVPAPNSIGVMRSPYSGYGTSNVPQREQQAIPAPDSFGMLRPDSVFAEDPRIGLQGPGYPSASKPRGTAGTYTKPYDRIASEVVTDPRTSLTPLGSLPAAKPRGTAGTYTKPYDVEPVKVAWNVPPMGGALPSQSAWGLGQWGTYREQPKGPAATPGTIHSKTASAEPAPTVSSDPPATGNFLTNALKNNGYDPEKIIQVGTDAVKKLAEGNKKVAKLQESPFGQLMLKMFAGGGGGGGNMPGNLGTPQDNSRMYGPQVQQASAGPAGMSQPANPIQYLLRIQQNMMAQGASPEDLAYIQSIIDELKTQVA